MNDRRAEPARRLGDAPGALAVDARRQRLFGLRLVDGGVSSGVDDDVGLARVDRAPDRAGVGEIELRPPERFDDEPFRRALQHRGDDLALRPGDENPQRPHANTGPRSARRGCFRSLSDSTAF